MWLALAALNVLPLAAAASPPLHVPISLVFAVDSTAEGLRAPLVASGQEGAADFVYLRFIARDEAVLGYDSWGKAEVLSQPFHLVAHETHRLDLETPALAAIFGTAQLRLRLRAWLDGRPIIDRPVRSYHASRASVFFGSNPIGGTSCGAEFPGRLMLADGHPPPSGNASWLRLRRYCRNAAADVVWWPRRRIFLVLLMLVVGAAIGLEVLGGRWLDRPAGRILPAVVLALSTVVFVFFMTGQSFRVFYPDAYGAFYDAQAVSLLHGRLDVPRESIRGEAFLYGGKVYGYFGPTPSLLRLPFALARWKQGELTRLMMSLEFAACLIATWRILRGLGRPNRRTALWVLINAGLGSSLLFLGSRGYVYHEAILCGAAWALIGVHWGLRYLREGGRGLWMVSWCCGVLSTQSRPTTGLFALGVLLAITLWRCWPRQWVRGVLLAGACVAGVLTFNGMSYLKFHTFEGAPFRYHVQYDAARLARFGGRNFHLSDLPLDANAYLFGANLEVRGIFPFFYSGAPNIMNYPGARMDLIEPLAPLPWGMPGLCLLAVAGAVSAFLARRCVQETLCLWIGLAPMALALLTAVAVSERYTADFCPWLAAAAATGMTVLATRPLARWLRSVFWLVTLASVCVNVGMTWDFQGERGWGSPPDAVARFQRARLRVDHFLGTGP